MRGWFMAGSHPGQYAHEVVEAAWEGRPAARVDFVAKKKAVGFGTLMQMFQAGSYRGKRMRLSMALRTEDVADNAAAVAFGALLAGRGQLWMADARFEPVGRDVPTTGRGGANLAQGPMNLDFSEE